MIVISNDHNLVLLSEHIDELGFGLIKVLVFVYKNQIKDGNFPRILAANLDRIINNVCIAYRAVISALLFVVFVADLKFFYALCLEILPDYLVHSGVIDPISTVLENKSSREAVHRRCLRETAEIARKRISQFPNERYRQKIAFAFRLLLPNELSEQMAFAGSGARDHDLPGMGRVLNLAHVGSACGFMVGGRHAGLFRRFVQSLPHDGDTH